MERRKWRSNLGALERWKTSPGGAWERVNEF